MPTSGAATGIDERRRLTIRRRSGSGTGRRVLPALPMGVAR
ncbi:hypothetical protein [Mycobacterium tuberculosis]|nr:hypothetical protein [Mycobacterium tuberculosis]